MTSPPPLDRLDHVHVHVTDRAQAEAWYARVLGLQRVHALADWAADGGPLTLADRRGRIHLALFERTAQTRHATIAFAVSRADFHAWRGHLAELLDEPPSMEDHGRAHSLYFRDPDGNPYEITTWLDEAGSHA